MSEITKVLITRAYKTELAPTDDQRAAFARHAGVARFVYNWGLARKREAFEKGEKSPSVYELKKELNQIKMERFPWLDEVSTYASQSAFDDLGAAYTNFFREHKKWKNGGRKDAPGWPKFKSRHTAKKSFRLYGTIHVNRDSIQLPRIGMVELKERGYLPAVGVKILNVTVSERAGRWFASLQVEQEIPHLEPRPESTVGVDVGIAHLATCSDGAVYENPKALKGMARKVARLQRELCRRQKGSSNRRETKEKLARLHYRIDCTRKDAAHKATTEITRKHTTVFVEDLNVAGMMKNHHLAGAIGDAAFNEFHRQLVYKEQWAGGETVKIDRWFPSSKTCSECGAIKDVLTLSDRVFRCDTCGHIEDRDLNASKNIKKAGLAGALKQPVAGSALETLNGCGGAKVHGNRPGESR